ELGPSALYRLRSSRNRLARRPLRPGKCFELEFSMRTAATTTNHSTNADLWQKIREGCTHSRECVIEDHMRVIRYVARRLRTRIAVQENERDDMLQDGAVGLLEAV